MSRMTRLVLARKLGQGVVVTLPDGRRGSVYFTKLSHDPETNEVSAVRLTFEFPEDVGIHRSEVQKTIDMQGSRIQVRSIDEIGRR